MNFWSIKTQLIKLFNIFNLTSTIHYLTIKLFKYKIIKNSTKMRMLKKRILKIIPLYTRYNNNIIHVNKILIIDGNIFIKCKHNYIYYKNIEKFKINIIRFNTKNYINIFDLNCTLNNYFKLDIILYTIIKYLYNIKYKLKMNSRLDYRIRQTNWGFYILNKNYKTKLINGFKFLYKILKFWLISLAICMFIIYYLLYIKLLPINKILFSWILLIMFLYWLISGFVFFLKNINIVNLLQ